MKDNITNHFCLHIIFLGGESVVCKDAIVKSAHESYHYLKLSKLWSDFGIFKVIQNCSFQMAWDKTGKLQREDILWFSVENIKCFFILSFCRWALWLYSHNHQHQIPTTNEITYDIIQFSDMQKVAHTQHQDMCLHLSVFLRISDYKELLNRWWIVDNFYRREVKLYFALSRESK